MARMPFLSTPVILFLPWLLSASASLAIATEDPARPIVLLCARSAEDKSPGSSLWFIAPDDYRVITKVDVGKRPRIRTGLDGRLACIVSVLDGSPSRDTWRSSITGGPTASPARAVAGGTMAGRVTVYDLRTGASVLTRDFPKVPESAWIDDERGQLVVRAPADHFGAGVLTTLDLPSARADSSGHGNLVGVTADATQGGTEAPRTTTGKSEHAPTDLEVLASMTSLYSDDLPRLRLLSRIPLDRIQSRESNLYFLATSDVDSDPKRGPAMQLFVVNRERFEIEDSLRVGWSPSEVLQDSTSQRAYVCAADAPGGNACTFFVLAGPRVVSRISLPGAPPFTFFRAAGDSVLVLTGSSACLVDTRQGRVLGAIPLSFSPASVAVDRNVQRMFVTERGGTRLEILDFKSGGARATLTCGSGGKRFLKGLGAATMTGLTMAAASYQAQSMAHQMASIASLGNGGGPAVGYGYARYYVFDVAPGSCRMFSRADDRFLYVYCTDTNDISVVDVEAANVASRIGLFGELRGMWPTRDANRVVLFTSEGVVLFDMRTNKLGDTNVLGPIFEKEFPDVPVRPTPLEDPARGRLLFMRKGGLTVFSSESGDLIRAVEIPAQPVHVIWGPRPAAN